MHDVMINHMYRKHRYNNHSQITPKVLRFKACMRLKVVPLDLLLFTYGVPPDPGVGSIVTPNKPSKVKQSRKSREAI